MNSSFNSKTLVYQVEKLLTFSLSPNVTRFGYMGTSRLETTVFRVRMEREIFVIICKIFITSWEHRRLPLRHRTGPWLVLRAAI